MAKYSAAQIAGAWIGEMSPAHAAALTAQIDSFAARAMAAERERTISDIEYLINAGVNIAGIKAQLPVLRTMSLDKAADLIAKRSQP